MSLPLNYLESFVAVCETLSFSEAAKRLSVSQPCVSRQIRLLESQLGTRLFVRDRHRVHLSEQGKVLRGQLIPVYEELRRTLVEVKDQSSRLSGKVSIGCLSEIGQALFMGVILEFQKKHPAVNVKVEYIREREIIEKVKQGTLGFGVVSALMDAENIRAFEILKERIILVTRARNKKDPEDLDEIPVAVYRDGDPLFVGFRKKCLGHLARKSFVSRIAVNSHRSIVDALLAGDAYAALPRHSVKGWLESGKLRQVGSGELVNPLYLIHVDNPMMDRRHQALKEHLLSTLRPKA